MANKAVNNPSFKNQDKLEAIVRECVNEYDPEDLLRTGCPDDEYDPEIFDIANNLRPGASRVEAWILVCNVLSWYFGNHEDPVSYWPRHRELADKIVSRIPEIDMQEIPV